MRGPKSTIFLHIIITTIIYLLQFIYCIYLNPVDLFIARFIFDILRPTKDVNLTFWGKISVGVKLRIYPYFIILEIKNNHCIL